MKISTEIAPYPKNPWHSPVECMKCGSSSWDIKWIEDIEHGELLLWTCKCRWSFATRTRDWDAGFNR